MNEKNEERCPLIKEITVIFCSFILRILCVVFLTYLTFFCVKFNSFFSFKFYDVGNILTNLRISVMQSEEESEKIADNFVSGKISLKFYFNPGDCCFEILKVDDFYILIEAIHIY